MKINQWSNIGCVCSCVRVCVREAHTYICIVDSHRRIITVNNLQLKTIRLWAGTHFIQTQNYLSHEKLNARKCVRISFVFVGSPNSFFFCRHCFPFMSFISSALFLHPIRFYQMHFNKLTYKCKLIQCHKSKIQHLLIMFLHGVCLCPNKDKKSLARTYTVAQ